MYQFLRALCRSCHDEIWDPVYGRFNYYNRDHEILYQEKPKLLRNELWDPNRVSDWTTDRVNDIYSICKRCTPVILTLRVCFR